MQLQFLALLEDEQMTRVGNIVRRILRMMELPSEQWRATKRGHETEFMWSSADVGSTQQLRANALREFFDNRKEGRGIWKWNHYFDIYDRHFHRFRGKEAHILEIGVYSGESLEMWRDYFGPKAVIYGVDIEPDCRAYESNGIKIFIGDQADRLFWREFRRQVPNLDIVIDDGGHQSDQQIVSVEELLPILRPGGVYLCEDVQYAWNKFASYAHGLGHRLNDRFPDDERQHVCCTPFQSGVSSIHLYPFITVLERNAVPVTEFRAPKHGTLWQPFYDLK
jgi:Methyltransferase domain